VVVHERRWEQLLAELGERNRDNVVRTASYLELYALTRETGRDLPWILMAHLVSRNGGYMMSDVAFARASGQSAFTRAALDELFLFLERANFLIFFDAWYHVLLHLLGRSAEAERATRFTRAAWLRYEAAAADVVSPALERALVEDLVTNEQHFIEHRVVHHSRFDRARAIVGLLESVGGEGPLIFPTSSAKIRVGGFAFVKKRISAGMRIFDEILANRDQREELFRWALAHPHTGSRAVYGGLSSPTIASAWPVNEVHALATTIHDVPEPDPSWP
jgi:hypothetical protein